MGIFPAKWLNIAMVGALMLVGDQRNTNPNPVVPFSPPAGFPSAEAIPWQQVPGHSMGPTPDNSASRAGKHTLALDRTTSTPK